MFALNFLFLTVFSASVMSIIDVCLDPINCEGENSGSNVGDPKDCDSYFICIKNSLYPRSCQKGLSFDVVKNGCMNPEQSEHCQEKCKDSSYERYVVHNPKESFPSIPTAVSFKTSVTTTASKMTTRNISSHRTSHKEISSTLSALQIITSRTTNNAPATSNPIFVEDPETLNSIETSSHVATSTTDVMASSLEHHSSSQLSSAPASLEGSSTPMNNFSVLTNQFLSSTVSSSSSSLTSNKGSIEGLEITTTSVTPTSTFSSKTQATSTLISTTLDPCLQSLPACIPGKEMMNPYSCKSYFRCTIGKELRWQRVTCVDGSFFDGNTGSCQNSATTCREACKFKPVILLEKNPDSERYAEGSRVAFSCSFQMNNVFVRAEVEDISWFKDGTIIKNASFPSGRIFVLNSELQNDKVWSTQLIVTNARPYDGGSMRCRMNYKIDGKKDVSENYFDFKVFGRPKVLLKPQSLTLLGKSRFNITCSVQGGGDDNTTYRWFINETPANFSAGLNATKTSIGSILVGEGFDNDVNITCLVGNSSVVSSNRTAYVYFRSADDKYCNEESVGSTTWPLTKAGGRSILKCPHDNNGVVTRKCTKAGSWDEADDSDCLNEMLLEFQDRLGEPIDLHGDNDKPTSDSFWESTKNTLANIKEFLHQNGSKMTLHELNMILGLVNNATHFRLPGNSSISQEGVMLLMDIMGSILNMDDNLLRQLFKEDDGKVISLLLSNVEDLAMFMARSMSVGLNKTLDLPAMIVTVVALKVKEQPNITFPAPDFNSDDVVSLEAESFVAQGGEDEEIFLSFASFKNLRKVLPNKDNRTINSSIISVVVAGNNISNELRTPVKFYYKALNTLDDKNESYCSYWDMKRNDWSQGGCRMMVVGNSPYCQCDHLTNFALLMSLSDADDFNNNILSIISLIGCIISNVSMLLTLIIFAVRWRKIKSHHLVVIINLCIALIVANIIFLAGVNRTESKAGCVVVGALLHFFYLAAFFLMLAEGVELLMYIVFVFHVRRSRELVALITLAWTCPLIVVAVTLGVTKTVGYTSDKSCWLSLSHGVIWAFVGPVLAIILANVIILAVVVLRVAGAKRPAEKDKARHRLRAAVWSVLVLTPVLGLTWVFGVLSVTKELIAFQYVFAIVNSLQGLFILIFHGLRSRKERPKYKYSVKESSSSNNVKRKALAYNRADRIASHSTASTSASSHLGPQRSGSDMDSVFGKAIILDNFNLMNESQADGLRKARDNGAFLPDIMEERAEESSRDSSNSTNLNNSDNTSATSSTLDLTNSDTTPSQLRARQTSSSEIGDKNRFRLSSC